MFTDEEYRILLTAMGREKKICKQVDKELVPEPGQDTLVDICKSIERKLHDAQYKYRDHDLRKNPNDLPTRCDTYLVKRPAGRWVFSDYVILSYEKSLWDDEGVVAWREIKPFELEEQK